MVHCNSCPLEFGAQALDVGHGFVLFPAAQGTMRLDCWVHKSVQPSLSREGACYSLRKMLELMVEFPLDESLSSTASAHVTLQVPLLCGRKGNWRQDTSISAVLNRMKEVVKLLLGYKLH